MTEPIVNNLTIQAATVNGSGSQTANLVLTRAIFHMGIPVAPKNVFPSNIEGLPTWYQLRITPQGHMARSDRVDILVAFNATTWREDMKTVRPGGVVIHEESYSTADARTDVVYYPVPFAKLAKAKIASETLRKQLANMIYVGVVAGVLGIPWESLEHGVKRQFLAKPKAVQVNLDAIKVGLDHYQDNFSKQDAYRLEPMTGVVEGKVLVEGNQAAALGALMGGVTVAAWYPITPSSSLCEYLIAYSDRFRTDAKTGEKRIAVVQAEDELAAVGMAIGASWAGARAMTSTSGPGISLMAEFAGLAYYAEVPAGIFDIQRIGPAPGLPTRTSQGAQGSGHDENARYTENANAYARNMDRLNKKFETARAAMPAPVIDESAKSQVGLIAFGSTHVAVVEARQALAEAGRPVDYMRIRALPLSPEVAHFVGRHERVYVVEQNRDGQMFDLIRLALPAELTGRLHS